MKTIFYGEEEQRDAKQFVGEVERATRVSPLASRISEANIIRDQIGEVYKAACDILERLTGPTPEDACGSGENAKDPHGGGALGELGRIQSSSMGYLAGLRRTIEQIGKGV